MFHPVLPGTYSYTLTPGQLFNIYFHRGIMRCLLWTSAVFLILFSLVTFLYLSGAIAFERLIPLLVGLFILDTIPLVAVVLRCLHKSRHPEALPGGLITLEWDSLSLCVSSRQRVHAAPWGEVVSKSVLGGGIMLTFADGRFAFIPPETPPEVMHALRIGIGMDE